MCRFRETRAGGTRGLLLRRVTPLRADQVYAVVDKRDGKWVQFRMNPVIDGT
jgi:hypothetical protein